MLARDLLIPNGARGRVDHLLEREQFDTVIRELGAFLEAEMRSVVGDAKAYGWKLVESYIRALGSPEGILSSHRKILRAELRTCLRFIRNGFAHEIVDLERPRALALISRLTEAIAAVQGVNEAMRDSAISE